MLALTLSGCAATVQKAALKQAVNDIEAVIHDLEPRANATETERIANQKHIKALRGATE